MTGVAPARPAIYVKSKRCAFTSGESILLYAKILVRELSCYFNGDDFAVGHGGATDAET